MTLFTRLFCYTVTENNMHKDLWIQTPLWRINYFCFPFLEVLPFFKQTNTSLCLSVCLSFLSLSGGRKACWVTVFWDLAFVSFTALSPWAWQKTHTPSHHGNPQRGKCVQVSSWPIHLFLSPTASLHPTHPSHPTPSSINAPNPLCGRVTSATVRNRVKLSRHQENGVGRSSQP